MFIENESIAPRQRRKEARPGELLSAALELFVEKGFAATRLEDVAARAGVSKGTLYLYFDSKATLLKAVVEEGIVPVLDYGEDIVASYPGTSLELIRHMLLTWWSRVGDSQLCGICKLMVAEASNFPEIANFYHGAVIARGEGLMRKALEMGIARGELRNIDIEVAKDSIFAPVLKLMLWRHSFAGCGGTTLEPEDYLGKHLEIVLHGLMKIDR